MLYDRYLISGHYVQPLHDSLTTINEHVIGAMHSTEECKGFHYRKEFQSNKR